MLGSNTPDLRNKFLRGSGEDAPGTVVEQPKLPLDGYLVGPTAFMTSPVTGGIKVSSISNLSNRAEGQWYTIDKNGVYTYISKSYEAPSDSDRIYHSTTVYSIPYSLAGSQARATTEDIMPTHVVTRYLIRALP